MAAAYGVDVLDPRLSLRRFWVLAQRLPPPARRGGEDWSTEAELLALVVDHLANLTWVTLRAAGSKSARRPRPLPRPRPRAVPAARAPARRRSWADTAAELAGIPGVIVDEGGGSGG